MTSFRLISVAAAALLFAQLHEAGGSPRQGQDQPQGPAAKPESKSTSCLAQMNEARRAAGLELFKEATDKKQLPTGAAENAKAKELCDAIFKDKASKNIVYTPQGIDGTFGFYLSLVEDELCSDAVEFWKGYRLSFGEPPVYKSDEDPPYDTYQSRSFLALFNPQPKPTIECVIVDCPYGEEKKAPAEKDGEPKTAAKADGNASPEKPEKSAREKVKECNGDKACLLNQGPGVLKSLVCVTSPAALVKGSAPAYTPEQWEKVRAQLSSGKMYSITAATSFVLAASALWLSAF